MERGCRPPRAPEKITFPTRAIVTGDRLRPYYGAADKAIRIAEASPSELLLFLRDDGVEGEGGLGDP